MKSWFDYIPARFGSCLFTEDSLILRFITLVANFNMGNEGKINIINVDYKMMNNYHPKISGGY